MTYFVELNQLDRTPDLGREQSPEVPVHRVLEVHQQALTHELHEPLSIQLREQHIGRIDNEGAEGSHLLRCGVDGGLDMVGNIGHLCARDADAHVLEGGMWGLGVGGVAQRGGSGGSYLPLAYSGEDNEVHRIRMHGERHGLTQRIKGISPRNRLQEHGDVVSAQPHRPGRIVVHTTYDQSPFCTLCGRT